jgi:hypothetical protein
VVVPASVALAVLQAGLKTRNYETRAV